MKKKYLKITRSDVDGSYINPLDMLHSIIDAEFDGIEYIEPGTSITIEIVELEEQEYEGLGEFIGW